MVKLVTKLEDRIRLSSKTFKKPDSVFQRKEVDFFGKIFSVYDQVGLCHLHLKLTDYCPSQCYFCVEQGLIKQDNRELFLINLRKILQAMQDNGILYSVSLTGGEPTVYPVFDEVVAILKDFDVRFLTLNTNATKAIKKHVKVLDENFDFINISRHRLTDKENNSLFVSEVLRTDELKAFKESLNNAKVRIQCIIDQINTIPLIEKFIDVYDFADNYSFRRLMRLSDDYDPGYENCVSRYADILSYAYKNYTFESQILMDYYLYETYKGYNNNSITFGCSDVASLNRMEIEENNNLLREIIVHPNGTVSGSWTMNRKIILPGKGIPIIKT